MLASTKIIEFAEKGKSGIKSVPFINGVFLPGWIIYRRVTRMLARRELDQFRRYCFNLPKLVSQPVFVKVGANDGITLDPCSDILFADTTWNGLLIEPVPHCFERLRNNFIDSKRFSLEQVAISSTPGRATFYYVDREAIKSIPGLGPWVDQLGSFDKNHIIKHFISCNLNGAIEPFIIECEVEVCTLSEVLKRNRIQDVHLLHIDTEGHDFEILKTVDFVNHAPLIIFVEHNHLSSVQKAEMRHFLRRHGYSVHNCGHDYFAVDKKAHMLLERSTH